MGNDEDSLHATGFKTFNSNQEPNAMLIEAPVPLGFGVAVVAHRRRKCSRN